MPRRSLPPHRHRLAALALAASALCWSTQAAPVAIETPSDDSEPAVAVSPAGPAWPLSASGLPSAVDLGGDSGDEAVSSDDPDGALLGLLRDVGATESAPNPRVAGAAKPPAAALPVRSPPPGDELPAEAVEGGLFDALAPSDPHLGLVSDVREWYRGTGAGADGASSHLIERDHRPEGVRGDKPVRERLIPQPLIDFLRENRVWIFVACLAGALFILAFDVMRRNARRGSQHRATADRHLPRDRRTPHASAAAAERRATKTRRSGPDRRSRPHPAAR